MSLKPHLIAQIAATSFQQPKTELAPHPVEAGTADIPGPGGLHATMDYLDNTGPQNIWRRARELADCAWAQPDSVNGASMSTGKTK